MGFVVRSHRCGCAFLFGCAMAALSAMPARAESDFKLFGSSAIEVSGDIRLVAVDGEKAWLEGGFGKLRSGSNGELRVQPQLGNVAIAWKPQFTWSLGATIVGALQGGQRTEAGLSQAFLTYRPMRGSKVSLSARAGLMWPSVSLEHEGADWHVKDSITPSAINSWIGEEVRPLAAEATIGTDVGRNKVRLTAALIAANDTSGTLLTFRGWALHDRTTLAFNRQPLPPLEDEVSEYQASFTHPLLDVGPGFASRPGYYLKLAWQAAVPVRLELFRYDNRADPEVVNGDSEWGWRTRFNHASILADLGGRTLLKAQALSGRTKMGYREPIDRWVDNRFRAAFVSLTKPFGPLALTGRVEAFGTRNRGSKVDSEYDESGWSAMLAAKRDWKHFTGLVELLHVSSSRDDRDEIGLDPRQRQNQLQAEVRMHW